MSRQIGIVNSVLTAAGNDLQARITTNRNGMMWTWGSNAPGQLGDGTRIDRNVPARVPGF